MAKSGSGAVSRASVEVSGSALAAPASGCIVGRAIHHGSAVLRSGGGPDRAAQGVRPATSRIGGAMEAFGSSIAVVAGRGGRAR